MSGLNVYENNVRNVSLTVRLGVNMKTDSGLRMPDLIWESHRSVCCEESKETGSDNLHCTCCDRDPSSLKMFNKRVELNMTKRDYALEYGCAFHAAYAV